MKQIEISPGVKSSVIGFGCAPILGSVSGSLARIAVDYAIDNGVNHFDLARSYGYGDAESFVGRLPSHKKNRLVIASKFGIQPTWKANLFRPFKPLFRFVNGRAMSFSNSNAVGSTKSASNVSNIFLKRLYPLRASDMKNSLEKSLRELKRDFLDYYMIHEPHQSIEYIDELQEMASKLKDEGKIRAWGLASMLNQSNLHSSYINLFDLVQFDTPLNADDYSLIVRQRGRLPGVIFSPIKGGPINMKPSQKMEALLTDFPNCVIVCSMFNTEHIKLNIEVSNRVANQPVAES